MSADRPPYPEPVAFDHAAAQQAIAQLNRAIATVKRQMAVEQPLRRAALEGWTGPHRDRFEGKEIPWIDHDLGRILDAMPKLVSQISSAADTATQHELANRRWHEQHDQLTQSGQSGDAMVVP